MTGRALYSMGAAFWNDHSPAFLVMSGEFVDDIPNYILMCPKIETNLAIS